MKGFVFTLDALFALIIAVSAMSLILYFNFAYSSPLLIKYQEAASILQGLSSINASSIPLGFVSQQQVNPFAGSNSTWFQTMGDYYGSGYSQSGPSQPLLSYKINAPSQVLRQILAGYGKIYIASANAIYAYNTTAGSLSWSASTVTNPSGMILYRGMVIYTNSVDIAAINAWNGNLMWSSAIPTSPSLTGVSTPLREYNGQIVFGSSGDYVAGFSPANGTMMWNSSNIGSAPTSIVADDGSLALVSPSNVALLSVSGNYAAEVWANGLAGTPSSNLASYKGSIALGSGSTYNALYVSGTKYASGSAGGQVEGVAAGDGYLVYQSSNAISVVNANGIAAWTTTPPSYFGTAVSGVPPVIGNSTIYSLWSNGYVLAQSIYYGGTQWTTQLPYSGTYNSLSLAYGRLYIAAGANVIALGQCPVQGGTVLSAVSQLYFNGYTGCADYLTDSVYPMDNYTIMIGNAVAPNKAVLNLTKGQFVYVKGNSSTASNAYTWSIWLKPFSWTGSGAGILGQNSVAAGAPYLVEQGSMGSPIISFSNNGGSGSGYTLSISNAIKMNAWQNIIVTYDYVSGTITMYVNGASQGTAHNGVTVSSTSNPLYIGFMQDLYPSSSFNGLVANLQIYNTSISAAQAYELYSAGISGGPLSNAGLDAWYPLGGDANDYSGLGNTGYLVGGHYSPANFTPSSLSNAFEVSRVASAVGLYNYSTGNGGIYSVSVVAWR